MRRAELLASVDPAAPAGEPGEAWLRLWAETLVLAFLTGRGLPAVPATLRRWWPGLDRRLRECLLATVLDRVVRSRALAIRTAYDPAALAGAAAGAALRMLGPGGAGTRPGPGWVIAQVRWLNEMERVCPLGGRPPDPAGRAPPPDFELPGLAGWPGMRMGHRLRALRRHRLSTELPRNRQVAWTVLLGTITSAISCRTWPPSASASGPGPSCARRRTRWRPGRGWRWCSRGRAGSWPDLGSAAGAWPAHNPRPRG
jgi:hypothetical protein